MFRTILGSDQVNSGKKTKINKQSHIKFWSNRKNMKMSFVHLAVSVFKKTMIGIFLTFLIRVC